MRRVLVRLISSGEVLQKFKVVLDSFLTHARHDAANEQQDTELPRKSLSVCRIGRHCLDFVLIRGRKQMRKDPTSRIGSGTPH